MSLQTLCLVVVSGAVLTTVAVASTEYLPTTLVERQVYVMGTRADLTVRAISRRAGLDELTRAARILEETDRELSTWTTDSVLDHLNRQPVGTPWTAPARLCVLLRELDAWRTATGGAFDPAIGRLIDVWGIRRGGRLPSPAAVHDAMQLVGLQHFSLSAQDCVVVRHVDAIIDAGAFGKGVALDRVRQQLGDADWMVNLGGQVAVGGSSHAGWRVDVAHPSQRDLSAVVLHVVGGSVAVTGGSERDVLINGQRIGHVVDPRTGRPVSRAFSVVVWHSRALVADILSTGLYVMGQESGIAWAEERQIAAAFITPVPPGIDVDIVATTTFRALPQLMLATSGITTVP